MIGPSTNIEFLKAVAGHEAFVAGPVETNFVPVSPSSRSPLCLISPSFYSSLRLPKSCRARNREEILAVSSQVEIELIPDPP